jgi:hypothetical protein
MAGFVPLPVIQKEAWAQCENPNCQKWRKLPPGAPELDEDAPWYCYLNPDANRNTCSASEVVSTNPLKIKLLINACDGFSSPLSNYLIFLNLPKLINLKFFYKLAGL